VNTAYLYDEIYLSHETGWDHPELPDRLIAIDAALQGREYYQHLNRIHPRSADFTDIERIHRPGYIKRVKREIETGTLYLDSMDTVVCRKSFDVALMAVGGCLAMCDAIIEGDSTYGFCSVRPPGHHAEEDRAEGFCIFNNIAIASRYLQARHGIKRIAIIDWDVHHGNGTQNAFYDDDSVYYISLHQAHHFPGTGAILERGRGKGKGYNLNLPMHSGDGDDQYLSALENRILPELETYKPEVILVSAGFDAHRADPLSSIQLSTETYYTYTRSLMDIAHRFSSDRVIAVLEGGYNLTVQANCVARVMDAFIEGMK
jgi:acetoin utilization deacetylase AcuC-like enzyme